MILAKTIKGYGLGEAGEGRNVTHQQKKLNEEELREFRARFGIPISDEDVARRPVLPAAGRQPEIEYLRERRAALGGFVPARDRARSRRSPRRRSSVFDEFFDGTGDREVSTTMAFVRLLSQAAASDPEIGKLHRADRPRRGAHLRHGVAVPPVRHLLARRASSTSRSIRTCLLYYHEAKDGQILEEGITEAGSMASFIAAGTAYATHGINTIPFFIYYSMFGFQRVGDLIWAVGRHARPRASCWARTAGRTTLAGEGLQHQDGHSHLLA